MVTLLQVLAATHFIGWVVMSIVLFDKFLPDIYDEEGKDRSLIGGVIFIIVFFFAQCWPFVILGNLIEKYEKKSSAVLP